MTTAPVTPYRSQAAAGRESFWHLVHAEWTKFRTVRGWMITMIVAIMAITAFVFLASNVSSSCSGSACPAPPTGPGGEPVTGRVLLRAPAADRERHDHRADDVADRPGRRRPVPDGARPAAVVQGRDHHQGEHVAGLGLRGDDGHRVPRRADAMGLRQRHARPDGQRVRGLAALAAAGPRRRHDHRVRLRRRHALDAGRHRDPPRTDLHRASRAVRRRSEQRQHRHGHGRLPPHRALLARYQVDGHQRRRLRPERRATARHAPPERRHDHRDRFRRHHSPRRGRECSLSPDGRWPGRPSG